MTWAGKAAGLFALHDLDLTLLKVSPISSYESSWEYWIATSPSTTGYTRFLDYCYNYIGGAFNNQRSGERGLRVVIAIDSKLQLKAINSK